MAKLVGNGEALARLGVIGIDGDLKLIITQILDLTRNAIAQENLAHGDAHGCGEATHIDRHLRAKMIHGL